MMHDITGKYPNLMEGRAAPASLDRNSPAYQAALNDVKEWIYVYLLTLANDARARCNQAKAEGKTFKYWNLIGVASAYHHASLGIFLDQELIPEMISHPYDDSVEAAVRAEAQA